MTPLSVYAASHGAAIRPHPATELAPNDGGSVVVVPNDTWRNIDDLLGDAPRTDTAAAVLVAPGLQRSGFMPNLIASTSIITPAVPGERLLDAVVRSMEGPRSGGCGLGR